MQFPGIHPKRAWPLVVAALLAAAAPARAQERAPARVGEPARPDDARPAPASPAEPPADTEDAPAEEFDWGVDIPETDRARAEALFLEGNQLFEDTLFARAADRYEQALALWDHPAFHYNLALARIHLDQPIAAYEHLQPAVRHGPEPLGSQERYTHARSYLKLLHGQLAELEVACDVPGARVTLDGQPLFVGPGRREVVIPPGGHVLVATKPGRVAHTRQIVLAPGQRARFSLAPAYPDRVVTVRRWPAWRPWAVVGAGALIAAGGGAVDWRALSMDEHFDRQLAQRCTNDAGCEPDDVPASLLRRRDRARAFRTAARITYAAGGAVLATGAVLLYLNRERPVKRRGPDPSAEVSVLPLLAPGAAGVSAHWKF